MSWWPCSLFRVRLRDLTRWPGLDRTVNVVFCCIKRPSTTTLTVAVTYPPGIFTLARSFHFHTSLSIIVIGLRPPKTPLHIVGLSPSSIFHIILYKDALIPFHISYSSSWYYLKMYSYSIFQLKISMYSKFFHF